MYLIQILSAYTVFGYYEKTTNLVENHALVLNWKIILKGYNLNLNNEPLESWAQELNLNCKGQNGLSRLFGANFDTS